MIFKEATSQLSWFWPYVFFIFVTVFLLITSVSAQAKNPVVFEFYTTETCTYSGEAQAAFNDIVAQDNVIALACYVGDFSSDPLSNQACKNQHSAYFEWFELDGMQTPLVVLNGLYDMSARPSTLQSGMALARSSSQIVGFEIQKTHSGGASFELSLAQFGYGSFKDKNYSISLYKYTSIGQYKPNTVFSINSLGSWRGNDESFGFSVENGNFSYTVLVRDTNTGRIIAAGTLEP